MPGVTRTTGSVVFPGGGGPQIAIPGIRPAQPVGRNGNRNNGVVTTYAYPVAYPVYVGGYGNGYYDQPPVQQQAPAQQPNVIVVYPPPPAYPAYPVAQGPVQSNMVEVPPAQTQEEPAASTESHHYLIALKDHSIYSAIAYWVDGNTLHYFTSGNTHSQVSVSQVDRDLTKRLNEDSGLELKLPPIQ